MNLDYLGDALDHWKGSLFDRLQKAQLLTNLAADAMASDAPDWTDPDRRLFAELLHIKPRQIVQHGSRLATEREAYFREIMHTGDLFLDPDIGIATGRVSDLRHLQAAELHTLLGGQPSRVVAVYQHIRGVKTRDRLAKVMSVLEASRLEASRQPFFCCSYESSSVAMLFFSAETARVRPIHNHFAELLGQHSEERIHLWNDQAA